MKKLVDIYKEFMGHGLPPRTFAIKFQVPLPVAREKTPKLRDLIFSKAEKAEPGYELAYLKRLQSTMRQLNRCRIGMLQRFLLSEGLLAVSHSQALEHVRGYSVESGIPDHADRQEVLDVIIDITRQLIDSYKIIFKTVYSGNNYKFVRQRKRYNISAFRILDLTKFKQRVKGLRYQLLSDAAWLAVNIVYHIMHAVGEANFSMEILANVAVNGTEIKTQKMLSMRYWSPSRRVSSACCSRRKAGLWKRTNWCLNVSMDSN
jgi:hypothetical protein